MAWTSRVGYGNSRAHHLLPFSEPSIAIRRKFDSAGGTQSIDLVLFGAAPDGVIYDPACGEEIFALRLCPEHLGTSLRKGGIEYLTTDSELPRHLHRHLVRTRELAEQERFVEAWQSMAASIMELGATGAQDRVGYAASLFRRSRGGAGPAEIAEKADVSPRHLRREFLRRYGLSPRAWRRRLRITSAMTATDQVDAPNWAAVAASAGYSDQSHMIRECRDITGMTPPQLHGVRKHMAETFNT